MKRIKGGGLWLVLLFGALLLAGCMAPFFEEPPLPAGNEPKAIGTPISAPMATTRAASSTYLGPAGWHMVSVPEAIEWGPNSPLRLSDGTTTTTLVSAAAAGWIQNTLWYWNAGSWVQYMVGTTAMLDPWKGYWLQTGKSGLTLLLASQEQPVSMLTWIIYVQTRWTYEQDVEGELPQRPEVSDRILRGDCEDFAIMVAYYIQEYWDYDTVIALMEHIWDEEQNHAVCFVTPLSGYKDYLDQECGALYPVLIQVSSQLRYIPIEQSPCPQWRWEDYNLIDVVEWNNDVFTRPMNALEPKTIDEYAPGFFEASIGGT